MPTDKVNIVLGRVENIVSKGENLQGIFKRLLIQLYRVFINHACAVKYSTKTLSKVKGDYKFNLCSTPYQLIQRINNHNGECLKTIGKFESSQPSSVFLLCICSFVTDFVRICAVIIEVHTRHNHHSSGECNTILSAYTLYRHLG